MDTSILFEPFQLGSAQLKNRIVMAPMTRQHSPGGVPDKEVIEYYERRAAGGAGLIVSEGTLINVPEASGLVNVPEFYGSALDAWKKVVDRVQHNGGCFFPQLWHLGVERHFIPEEFRIADFSEHASVGPSGLLGPDIALNDPMSEQLIEQTIDAYVQGIVDAMAIGCDGVELHGAHGYLIDQFLWQGTNQRTDRWGGDAVGRARFVTDIVSRARAIVGNDFPIVMRISQWKTREYTAKLAESPDQLEDLLEPMVDAGVSAFHCSTRRFWKPEFEGSDMNLAGWVKKLTGLPTISVGSVGLDAEFSSSDRFKKAHFSESTINDLLAMMERGDFDLVAVGRAFLANPNWPDLVKNNRFSEIKPYSLDSVATLY